MPKHASHSESDAHTVKTIRIVMPEHPTLAEQNIAALFTRIITNRCSTKVETASSCEYIVELRRKPAIGPEGYIIDTAPQGVRITASDERGLLYGVGKLLHTSRYDRDGFTPGDWRGTSKPECSFRAIYAATHFMNYYEAAPEQEVLEYLEELALWGANTVVLTFPTWQFTDINDPAAQNTLRRIHRVLSAWKKVGLQAGLIQCPNQAYTSAPQPLRAAKYPDDLGRRGTHGVNCCPGSAQGLSYLTQVYTELFRSLSDIDLDYIIFWPYDEGGCGCPNCWPWGAKGFPNLSHHIIKAAQRVFPNIKSILSTWTYDTPPAGEWEGLSSLLSANPNWFNYIMADAHEDYPTYPLVKGVPGKLPLLNFPEISMWGRNIWGGYGANPLPSRLQRLWNQTRGKLSGGLPYSEGIYEDINKVICLGFYWDKRTSAEESLKQYVAYEYSPVIVPQMVKAMKMLEANWLLGSLDDRCLETYGIISDANAKLPSRVQASWRWRIVYLRAVIDRELYMRQGKLEGDVLRSAFNELTAIYHVEHGHSMPIKPPVIP